jgi:hypothetical protein
MVCNCRLIFYVVIKAENPRDNCGPSWTSFVIGSGWRARIRLGFFWEIVREFA